MRINTKIVYILTILLSIFNFSETILRIHLGLKQVSAEIGINCSTRGTLRQTRPLFSGQNTVVMVGTSIDT